MVHLKASQD